jgi:hypothetical protein
VILSDEQMNAVNDGGIGTWEEVPRPLGPRPLPDWVNGAAANWGYGYGNAPTVKLKVDGNVFSWPDQRWAKEGSKAYISRHPDGRARVHYHDGPISTCGAWRVFENDKPLTYKWMVVTPLRGETPEDAARREGEAHLQQMRAHCADHHPNCELRIRTVQATTQQGGYGGDGYELTMLDGSVLILRGPWHGGAPAGYVEVTAWDRSTYKPSRWDRSRRWHRRGGTAGLYITEDLFLRIVARFIPEAPVLRVQHSYGTRLELTRAEWGRPKEAVYEDERQRSGRGEPAGHFWRVYWDGRGGYCGSLRIPTHGFLPGVDQRVPENFD